MIANNFVSVYRILTKLGTKMHPYTTFMCTEFRGNQIIFFRFVVTFIPRRKEEEKKKKTKKLSQFLKAYISETPCVI